MSLDFTVKSNLASSIRNYLKAQGKNVSESDMNKILQRMADVNSARSKEESIFNGGHRYLGGSGKDFIVQNGQQVKLSAEEYNKIFEGYLDSAETVKPADKEAPKIDLKEIKPLQLETPKPDMGEVKLSDDAIKSAKDIQFKNSLSQMSDKQLRQIANSDNLTQDLDQLNMLATEIGVRGDQKTARKVAKFMREIQAKQASEQTQPAQQAGPQQKPVITNHDPVNAPTQPLQQKIGPKPAQPAKREPLSEEKLNEYLAQDANYQRLNNQLSQMDARMKEIEQKYNFERDNTLENFLSGNLESSVKRNSKNHTFADFDLDNHFDSDLARMKALDGKPEKDEYADLNLKYSSRKSDLNEYKKRMQNWQDGVKYAVVQRGPHLFTNVELITLKNGQHAYKSDRGHFFPDFDGGISLNPVPAELLE